MDGIESVDDLFNADIIAEKMADADLVDSYGNRPVDLNIDGATDDGDFIQIDDVSQLDAIFGGSDDDDNPMDEVVDELLEDEDSDDYVELDEEDEYDDDDYEEGEDYEEDEVIEEKPAHVKKSGKSKKNAPKKSGKKSSKKHEMASADDLFVDIPADGDDDDDEYDDAEYVEAEYDFEFPEWVLDIERKVNASVAHAFLLSGNVRDYMTSNITIKDGIVSLFDPNYENFDIIAEYDQAHGLSFYGLEVEVNGEDLSDVYRARFMEEMEESCNRLSIPVPSEIPNRDPVLLFTIISDMFEHDSHEREAKMLLIIDYSDFLVPDASSAQMKPDERKLAITLADIGRSQAADDAGNIMFFITDDITQLSTRVRNASSRIEHIKIPIPNQEEREAFIDEVLDDDDHILSSGVKVFDHPDSIDKKTFSINSAGLSRIQIEDIMLRAMSDDVPLTMSLMKERKQEIIKEDYDDVLEIIDPNFGFERVGGMEQMKGFFREEIIEPIHAGELEAVPMGLLMAGPPGVAKRVEENTPVTCINIDTNEIYRKPIKEVKIGDYVFSEQGHPTKVIDTAYWENVPIYEFVLKDGRIIECSDDHRWKVCKKSHGKYPWQVLTTQEILDFGLILPDRTGKHPNRLRWYVPMNEATCFPEKEYDIDPYVIGAFLGDGCCTLQALTISSSDIEIVDEIKRLIGSPDVKSNQSSYNWTFRANEEQIDEMNHELVDSPNRININTKWFFRNHPELLGSASEKRIPEEYKFGSIEQRWALIQGLFDTDGSINDRRDKDNQRYNIRFGNSNKELIEDIREVLFSLGISSTLRTNDVEGQVNIVNGKKYIRHGIMYELNINCPSSIKPNFFRLSRKKEIAEYASQNEAKTRNYERIQILDIRKTDRTSNMACISVDNPEHLYLIGKDYVVTHNTFFSKAVAYEANMNFVALNLNRILDKWVGASERNLDRALDCAMAMAPTIIFIDEIDEALPNRADPNQSSVNKRINQRLLTFFSDTSHRGQVMILAATNYPEKIDPAFKRAGRFDMRVPMFAPDEFDRMRIMNVIAKGRGYSFSWFKSPDTLVENPFKEVGNWIREGNVPINEKNFVGERNSYEYQVENSLGNMVQKQCYLPQKLIDIIDKEQITLQQVYENVRILFEDLPDRKPDPATNEIATDDEFKEQLRMYLADKPEILGKSEKNREHLLTMLWDWQMKYGPFSEQTFQMTGAELDVVMNKAITLFRRWKRKKPENFKRAIEMHVMKDEYDIPWNFLFQACIATINAVAGIKLMEDNALLNTSDLDFIPDALYAETDDGRKISYRERHEELTARQTKSTLG